MPLSLCNAIEIDFFVLRIELCLQKLVLSFGVPQIDIYLLLANRKTEPTNSSLNTYGMEYVLRKQKFGNPDIALCYLDMH